MERSGVHIDGATNSTTTMNAGTESVYVAVNPVTNKVYVSRNDFRPQTVAERAAHLHVRLIHSPGTADRAGVSFPTLLELRAVTLHPAQNGRMREVDTTFIHHGHQVAKAQFVAEVPTHADDHDLLVKVPTLEQLLDRYESWHLSIIADSVPFAPEPLRFPTSDPALRITGVGRLVELHTPGVAELLVIVSDPFQRRGIGAHLMERIIELAKAEKVQRIVGTVLYENLPMRKLFERYGFTLGPGVDRETLGAELKLI